MINRSSIYIKDGLDSHIQDTSNPHQISTEQIDAINISEKGVAEGVATLDKTGKVSVTQTRPSNVSYDGNTGTFTFTWANGSIQSINTPIESVFQNVNYDSDTKTVVFTLSNGRVATIALTDLVDLPEIKLSTQNPATNPTSGQKLYIRTDTGEYWTNIDNTWSGPSLNYTSAERNKLEGISKKATANATDAKLRDRATHTGIQGTDTIDGLDVELENISNHMGNLSNPHNITTTQIGAISIDEKGIAEGVATLDSEGKLLAAESRASTVVYDRDTGILSFTWADGSIQEINTSIEATIHDAKFSSDTKVITFTRGNDSEIEVDLSTLENIPEIEIASDVPKEVPGEYKKLYISVVTGEYWVNVNNCWIGPFLPFTSNERAKLENVDNNATKNATDEELKDRKFHTGTQPWDTITNTPNTLAGYGIKDGVFTDDSRLSDTRIPTLGSIHNIQVADNANIDWTKVSKLGAKASDIGAQEILTAGTGIDISDGVISTTNSNITWGNLKGSIEEQLDLKTILETKSSISHTHAFSTLTNTPTTLSGYGITDAVGNLDSRLSDSRTPKDSSVTNVSIAPNADISWSKIDKTGAVAADVGALDNSSSIKINQDLDSPINTGNIAQLFSWLAGRIKAITGGTHWFDSPATNLLAASTHMTSTTNPHATTAAQVGSAVAQWNASKLQNKPIASPTIDNSVPIYNVSGDSITWKQLTIAKPLVRATRGIAAQTGIPSSGSIWTPLIYNTKVVDTLDCYDPRTGNFKCPLDFPGRYKFAASVALDTICSTLNISLFVNGTRVRTANDSRSNTLFMVCYVEYDLAPGDVVNLRILQMNSNSVNAAMSADSTSSYLDISYIPDSSIYLI